MPQPRTPRSERTIPMSTTGRLYWRPSDPHPLDILVQELETLNAQLPTALTSLREAAQQAVHHLQACATLNAKTTPPRRFTRRLNGYGPPLLPLPTALPLASMLPISQHSHHLQLIFARKRRQRLLGPSAPRTPPRPYAPREILPMACSPKRKRSQRTFSPLCHNRHPNTPPRHAKPVLSHDRLTPSILSILSMPHRNHHARKRRCACTSWRNPFSPSLPWSVRSHARDNCCASLQRNCQHCGPIWLSVQGQSGAMVASTSSWSPNVARNRKSSRMAS